MLSRFERTRRVVLHRAPGRTLRVGQVYTLNVRVVGRRVRARIGEGRELPSVFSLDAGVTVTKGMPGVLVVAGPPMGRSALAVSRYELAGPTGAATPIRPTYLLTGTPVVSKGEDHCPCAGRRRARLPGRDPACLGPGFGSALSETAPVTVTAPSYTAKTAIPVRTSVWWRAVLIDPRSRHASDDQSTTCHTPRSGRTSGDGRGQLRSALEREGLPRPHPIRQRGSTSARSDARLPRRLRLSLKLCQQLPARRARLLRRPDHPLPALPRLHQPSRRNAGRVHHGRPRVWAAE